MKYFQQNEAGSLTWEQVSQMIKDHISENNWKSALLIPPDITRSHSGAGPITALYYEELTKRGCKVKVLPALGTHTQMTKEELVKMFGTGIPDDAYLVHNFQKTIAEVGVVPAADMTRISQGLFNDDVHLSINPELLKKEYDVVLSIGQVIPHEIAGMANYTKNIVVGCGGGEMINVSHFLGVYYGLENLLGVDHNPVRDLFDYCQEKLLNNIPFTFVQTVMKQIDGKDSYIGVFIGKDRKPYEEAVKLSQKVNFNYVEKPIKKCVVWMDPASYHSTWVTNKAIYRTQLAVEKGGDIIIIAPGVRMFGENDIADPIIRKYGYMAREKALELSKTDPVLKNNLSMAGHLIHGVPGNGIKVTYCTDKLTKEDIEGRGYDHYLTVEEALEKYPCENWQTGWKTLANGEEIYFVRNAALGLWRYGKK